jgi:L-lactate dehydrogenase (cytochrome)
MRSTFLFFGLAATTLATEPFLNEPDTGLETFLQQTNNWTEGTQPALKDIRGLNDFDFAARQKLSTENYFYYRTGSAGEWSYRNNLDIWQKVKFRPRFLSDTTKVNETLGITILGYNFTSPVFISPAPRAQYGNERGELNYVEASANEDTLYIAAMYAQKTIEEISAAKSNTTINGPQVIFQQVRFYTPCLYVLLTI